MGHIRDRWKEPGRAGKGKRWQVKYQVDGRERSGGTFKTKPLAERKRVELESAVHRGAWVDPTDQTTLVEYARRHAAARPYRPTTSRRVTGQIERHLAGTALGRRRLVSVRPSDVQAWASELSKTLAPATVVLLVNMLKSMYAAAVLDRLVAASPVVRVALPRAERARIVPLSVVQVLALSDVAPGRNRAMVLTQAGLGLRLGELLAVRAQDVNFLGRSVRVEHQLADRTRQRVDPKTPRSRRTVPLPAAVATALSAHMAEFPPLDDGSLFYGHNRRPYAHTMYGSRIFAVAVRRLAATDPTFPARTTTHDLRHHYASVLLAAGESVVAVAERLGHDDAGMVLRVYGHLMPDTEDRTRRAIDEAWSAALRPAATEAR